MKVGLIRHFEVNKEFSTTELMTPGEYSQWVAEYDISEIKDGSTDLNGIKWEKCFSSDLPRAVETAQRLYDGPIVVTKALREIPIYPVTKKNVKLPFSVWMCLGRAAWFVSHKSQLESRQDVYRRMKMVLEDILKEKDKNVLIVSHGALMIFLRRELAKRGFKGPSFKMPVNGKLYVFEKRSEIK